MDVFVGCLSLSLSLFHIVERVWHTHSHTILIIPTTAIVETTPSNIGISEYRNAYSKFL